VLVGEHALRERLADDCDRFCAFGVEVVEIASLEDGNAKGREKARRDSAPVRAGIIVAMSMTIRGVLGAWAKIIGIAPGSNEAESSASDARQRCNLADRFLVEVEDLLRRFAVGHRGDVNGEHLRHVKASLHRSQRQQRRD
jgi:hypothetical protein